MLTFKRTFPSRAILVAPAAILIAVFVAACSGGTTVLVDVGDGAGKDVAEVASPVELVPDSPRMPDVPVPTDVTDMAGEQTSSCQGPGCFGDPCESGVDCRQVRVLRPRHAVQQRDEAMRHTQLRLSVRELPEVRRFELVAGLHL